MKKLAIIPLALGTFLMASPAFGQTAYENCKRSDTQNQVLGAVVGGSLGAIIGNEISGDTGAVVGGLAGGTAGVAVADKNCEQYKARPYVQPNRATTQRHHVVTYDRYGNRVVTTTRGHNYYAKPSRKVRHSNNKRYKNSYYRNRY